MTTAIFLAWFTWHSFPPFINNIDVMKIPPHRQWHPPTQQEMVGPANEFEGIYFWYDEAVA